MRYFKFLLLALIVAFPYNTFASNITRVPSTDRLAEGQITSYYDLRDRKTYVQVTNTGFGEEVPITIHVQIFQHDRNCDELDFFDELTLNDTVVYDLDNIIKNDGSKAPIDLQDNSYGYIVISTLDPTSTDNPPSTDQENLIGNFRIIDIKGYEYRSNMVGATLGSNVSTDTDNLIANFNTVDGAIYADVVGYGYGNPGDSTVTNVDNGFSFDIFVFDLDEEPLSCDRRNFACGNVMNYGINEDYFASREDNLLCPGASLPDPKGGFISFENGLNLDGNPPESDNFNDMFVGFIGLNNNNGTGSMDIWWYGLEFSF